MSGLDGIIALAELVRTNVSTAPGDNPQAIDVGFFHVIQRPDSTLTAKELADAIKAAEQGHFQDEPVDRLLEGPSYIELGGWLGDQTTALCFMGLGKILGLWEIMTPEKLGITDPEQVAQMKGMGFVMIAPGTNSLLRA